MTAALPPRWKRPGPGSSEAFARLGSKVTVIEAGPTFLGLEEPEAGAALRPHLEADGITLKIGDPCVAVEGQSGGGITVR